MKRLAFAILLFVATPAAAEPNYAALNADAMRQHIWPRYEALAAATAKLDGTAKAFCAGSKRDLGPVREDWRGAMAAWQGIQHVRFGPAEWFNRVQRFAFWPDPRNVATRQLADLFSKADPQALTAQGFVTGSVAVQGFSALERELFDEGEAQKLASEPYRCAWLTGVTGSLAAMARDIVTDWTTAPQEFGKHFAAGHSTAYQRPSEATLDLFKSLYTAVELVADHKLARPLGASAKAARSRLAESWRSETSLANVSANLAAARDLFERLRPGVTDAALVAEIGARFDAARAAAAAIGGSLEDAVGDPARRPAVERLRREVLAIKTALAERLTAALGLPLGFNALDGD